MWQRFDTYVKAIWKQYKLPGFIAIIVLLLAAAYLFGVDLGGAINRWMGL
jgi:hypothetical protein